jgi:hypothetical protein
VPRNHHPHRTPVERLKLGDLVQAVDAGPLGKVIDPDRYGWTLVEYHQRHEGGTVTYKHGLDGLYLIAPETPL